MDEIANVIQELFYDDMPKSEGGIVQPLNPSLAYPGYKKEFPIAFMHTISEEHLGGFGATSWCNNRQV